MRVGEYDESDPNGIGYKIMTRDGLKVFDLTERDEYEAEKAKFSPGYKKPRKRALRDNTRQCRRCHSLHSSHCLPPVSGPCKDFIQYFAPRNRNKFHYA